MKKTLILLFIILSALTLSVSCSDETVDVNSVNKQTILIYMPWSGSGNDSGLLTYFKANLDSIEQAIIDKKGLTGSRVLVMLSKTAAESELYEIVYDNASKATVHRTLNTYKSNDFTTAEGITSLLNEVRQRAEALNYAMIIGCHGCGWTYKEDWMNYPYNAKGHSASTPAKDADGWPFRPDADIPQTRFFGSVTSMDYATDISTLAKGIEDSGIKMQYILFDDCYMSNAETAYELRNATNFLIGSSSEVMAMGMPYKQIWTYLNSPTPNYSSIVSAFVSFYSNYAVPCGNLAAIDCRQMENLANVMREINSKYMFDGSRLDNIQKLGGFNPTIFYDMGNYVDSLKTDEGLRDKFKEQLKATVKAAQSTDKIYSALYGRQTTIEVKTFSGLTISDPSTNIVALRGKEKTAWWKATH